MARLAQEFTSDSNSRLERVIFRTPDSRSIPIHRSLGFGCSSSQCAGPKPWRSFSTALSDLVSGLCLSLLGSSEAGGSYTYEAHYQVQSCVEALGGGLAFGYADRGHSDYLVSYAKVVTDFSDPVHILVGVWCFLCDYFHAGRSYHDSSALQ
jgi:hypothetical protein